MNKQGPKGIEWLRGPNGEPGYTWNPIKGLCPEGCWYCYARRIYQRFGMDSTPRLELSGGTPDLYSTPSRVFVCSTFELFHPVADEFRDRIFSYIVGSPHTFIILTKHPERIDRPMPENVYLGVSVTGGNQIAIDRLAALYGASARVKFVSMEPLLELPNETLLDFMTRPGMLQWAIVGRLTGHGHKHDPVPQSLERIGQRMKEAGIPLFAKNNLAGIWPGPLIQELPTARASSNGRASAFQADDPGSSPGARSINPKGGKA